MVCSSALRNIASMMPPMITRTVAWSTGAAAGWRAPGEASDVFFGGEHTTSLVRPIFLVGRARKRARGPPQRNGRGAQGSHDAVVASGAALVPGLTRDRPRLGVWNGPGSSPGQV